MSLTRRNLLKGIAVSGALGATAAATGVLSTAQAVVPAKKTGKQPNLLIIFPDEMRTQSLGFMGQDPSITPFINQFASQSVVLKQAVSNYPLLPLSVAAHDRTIPLSQWLTRQLPHGG